MEQSPSWEADQSSQLVKKFPAFYGTQKFFTVLTSARHPSLSWANSIQSPPPPQTFSRSILILSSRLRLGLPNGFFPLRFPYQHPVHRSLLPHSRHMHRPSHSSIKYTLHDDYLPIQL
jgi:hypothetical protein